MLKHLWNLPVESWIFISVIGFTILIWIAIEVILYKLKKGIKA